MYIPLRSLTGLILPYTPTQTFLQPRARVGGPPGHKSDRDSHAVRKV